MAVGHTTIGMCRLCVRRKRMFSQQSPKSWRRENTRMSAKPVVSSRRNISPVIVVFDLGKVLVDFDYRIAARKIASRGTVSPTAVQEFIDHSPLLVRYETGRMTRQEFF